MHAVIQTRLCDCGCGCRSRTNGAEPLCDRCGQLWDHPGQDTSFAEALFDGDAICPLCRGRVSGHCGIIETSTGLPDGAFEYGCAHLPDLTYVF